MNEQIKQIAERLRGLRDVLELTEEDIAIVTFLLKNTGLRKQEITTSLSACYKK